MTRAQLLDFLSLSDETLSRQRAAPLLFYRPHEKAKLLHGRHWSKRRTVINGGNKSGKSWMGCYEALAHAYGYRFWEVPGLTLTTDGDLPPRERVDPKYWVRTGAGVPITVPNKGMIVTGQKLLQGIGETIWPILEDVLPPTVRNNRNFKALRGAQSVVIQVVLPNGSEFILASALQEDLSWEGSRLQWAWLDEPSQAGVYNGLWRGLSMDQGHIWFTLTPLKATAAWLYTDIVAKAEDDTLGIQVFQEDNPYFAAEARRQFADKLTCSDAEKRARLYGDWEALGNRIIHNFDRRSHVIPAQSLPRDWLSGQTVDPHHARPAAVVWWRLSPWGVYHFYREWPQGDFTKMTTGGRTPSGYADLFRSIEGGYPAQVRIVDPRFGKAQHGVHGEKQTAWAEQMEEFGLHYDTRIEGIHLTEIGEQKIVEMLRFSPDFPIGPTNTPRILIHDCCPNLIRAMENYGLKLNTDPTKTAEKPSEEFKDFIDAVRYTVLFNIPATEIDFSQPNASQPLSDRDWERENYEDESFITRLL